MPGKPLVIPKPYRKVLVWSARRLWREEIANLIPDKMLIHYAMACNALSDYLTIKDRLESLEKEGKDTHLSENNNGTLGVHPLRQSFDKARKAFADEMKRCGVTLDVVTAAQEAAQDFDPYAGEDKDD